MNQLLKPAFLIAALLAIPFLESCKKDDPQLPDNLVAFESDQLGIGSDEAEINITLAISRAVSTATTLTLSIASEDVVYGTDFTTDPAATASTLTLTVPPNETSVTFKVVKVAGALFDGDETATITLTSANNELVLGEKQVLTLTFGEIVAASGTMEVAGGGPLFPNKVFIDLSGNRQTSVERTTWDLGFSTTDDFRVILNSSTGMMARVLDKTDLNTVTAADTVGWGPQLSIAAVFAAINLDPVPDWVAEAIEWIDDPTGNLDNTAINAVSATASENKVYIISRGTGPGNPATQLGWKKIRIVRNGSNYTLQHADIAATSFSEIQITKDSEFRFQYVHFSNGAATVEPEQMKWDIAWTGFTNSTNFGTGPVPYYFQDIILQNSSDVETVEVLTSAITYENFSEANIAGLTFSTSQVNIGSKWRTGGGPSGPPNIKTDRFYVIKDGADNYYKLKFTALTTDGERGRPQLEYALVQEGTN